MESRILREAMTAYQAVYDPELRQQLEEKQAFENWVNSLVEEGHDLSEYTWEDMYEEYLEENPKYRTPANDLLDAIGRGFRGLPGALTKPRPGLDSALNKPRGLNQKPAAKPAPTPAAKPAPTPAAKPAPTPAAKPAPTPAAKPAPTARPTPTPTPRPTPTPTPSTTAPSTKPYSGSGYKKDTSITDMIGRSQIRQGAPINTGNKSSDVRSMALRGSVGSSTPAKTTPTPVNRATGSKKPGSVYSSFDMFDLVKGHLLDEGYADTEEAAIAIMANMSEEWRDSIISEAPGEWFGGLRDKARASRAAQIQASKPTPKPGPTVSSPFAKPASRTDSGRLTTYGAGGGAAAERSGKTRSQVMKQGATNLETRNKSNPGPNFGR